MWAQRLFSRGTWRNWKAVHRLYCGRLQGHVASVWLCGEEPHPPTLFAGMGGAELCDLPHEINLSEHQFTAHRHVESRGVHDGVGEECARVIDFRPTKNSNCSAGSFVPQASIGTFRPLGGPTVRFPLHTFLHWQHIRLSPSLTLVQYLCSAQDWLWLIWQGCMQMEQCRRCGWSSGGWGGASVRHLEPCMEWWVDWLARCLRHLVGGKLHSTDSCAVGTSRVHGRPVGGNSGHAEGLLLRVTPHPCGLSLGLTFL